MIRIKNNLTPGLPNEYQEVEYIESTGTQCIDTGIPLNQYRKCEMEFSPTSIGTTQMIDGGYTNTSEQYDTRNYLRIDSDGMLNLQYAGSNTSYKLSSVVIASNIKYAISYKMLASSCFLTVNEAEYSISTGVTLITNNNNVFLFGESFKDSNLTKTYEASALIKLYTAKYYDSNDILIRNFIPCYRKSDNEVGLYDLVNNVFCTNAGTGVFLMGEAVGMTDANLMPMVGNKKLLKRYIGENLVYQKKVDTEFTSCPFPTDWTSVSSTEYNSTNDYGKWIISSTEVNSISVNKVDKAFDQDDLTSFASVNLNSDSSIASIEIDCPAGIKIKPSSLYIYLQYIKSATITGLNEDDEWEQLTSISRTSTKTEYNKNIATEKYFSKFKVEMTRYGSSNKKVFVYEFQIKSGTLRKGN